MSMRTPGGRMETTGQASLHELNKPDAADLKGSRQIDRPDRLERHQLRDRQYEDVSERALDRGAQMSIWLDERVDPLVH